MAFTPARNKQRLLQRNWVLATTQAAVDGHRLFPPRWKWLKWARFRSDLEIHLPAARLAMARRSYASPIRLDPAMATPGCATPNPANPATWTLCTESRHCRVRSRENRLQTMHDATAVTQTYHQSARLLTAFVESVKLKISQTKKARTTRTRMWNRNVVHCHATVLLLASKYSVARSLLARFSCVARDRG